MVHRIISSDKPKSIQYLGNNNYYYNYDIQEIQILDKQMYSFIEIKLTGNPDYKQCIKEIIRQYVSAEEELDLINSANASTNNVVNNSSNITNYTDYLNLVNTIKINVKNDFNIELSSQQEKLDEINNLYQKAKEFYIIINNTKYSLWLNSETRTNLISITLPTLLSNNIGTFKLWTLNHECLNISTQWLLDNLPKIELYSKQIFDLKQEYESMIYLNKEIDQITFPNKIELIWENK